MKLISLLVFLSFSVIAIGSGMRIIEYERHEYHGEPESRSAELSVFVYDIPHFGACGIFPPHHIANERFKSGGSEGGMSPGATWQPFEISIDEYENLVREVERVNPRSLGERARFTWVKFEFDRSFDQMPSWELWLVAVCGKHRESFHRRQGSA